jgi:PST family polysaccharide transporter
VWQTLVQRDNITDDHTNVAFWVNLLIALTFIGLIQFIAGWVAALMHVPILEPVLRVMSFSLLAFALSAIAAALFIRDLQYKQFALRTFVTASLGAAVGIAMALTGYGVWALVGQQLSNLVGIAVLWKAIKWRPTLSFSTTAFCDIYHFTSRLMAGNALRFAVEKCDALIIGAFLDVKALGYYFLMTRLLMTLNMATVSPIDQVMLPILSRMKHDRQRRAETYANMVGIVSAFWVPAVTGLGIASPILLPLLFGSQWSETVPLMMIASLTAISAPLNRPTIHILLSVGRPDAYLRLNLLQLVLTVISFIVGVQFGILGAAASFAGVWLAMAPINLMAVHRIAQVPVRLVLSRHLPPIAASGIMVVALFAVGTMGHSAWVGVTEIAVGVVVYPIALYRMAPARVSQFFDIVYSALPLRLKFLGAQ